MKLVLVCVQLMWIACKWQPENLCGRVKFAPSESTGVQIQILRQFSLEFL